MIRWLKKGNDDVYTFYESNAYCLDMDTGNWKTISKMPTTRSGPSVACVGDKIYAIGGYRDNNNECYDPATDTWTAKSGGPSSRPTLDNTVGLINDMMYFV